MKHLRAERTFTHGIAEAAAYIYKKQKLSAATHSITEVEVEENLAKFDEAIKEVSAALQKLAAESAIFEGHLSIANDIALLESVSTKIKDGKQNVELAVQNTIEEFSAMMSMIDDPYMQERAVDILDVGDRFMHALQGKAFGGLGDIEKPVIIIAEDLTPSDTSSMNFEFVKGFITEEGGVTSHVAIIARSLGVPALVGVNGILGTVTAQDHILFDAESGDIYINPDADKVAELSEKASHEAAENARLMHDLELPTVTLDGKSLKVYGNIGSTEDLKKAMKYKLDGVGLYRTEFLFMDCDHFPTEEEQFNAYKTAIEELKKELIIRTLDIGGDKGLSYYEFEAEENPFLGWRAIRMCLIEKEIFKAQIKALLRASAFGPIKVMIPMIISVDEVRAVKELVEECKDELRKANISYNDHLPIGIMIETPAAVMMADELAGEVDFFSIGTNDLTQYILSVDRGNKRVEKLYNSYHPAVLRAIHRVIHAANKAGIEVGMCGEFASDPHITEVLLGFGIDEYSMAPGEIPRIKDKIRHLDFTKAKELAAKVLKCKTTEEVYQTIGLSSL